MLLSVAIIFVFVFVKFKFIYHQSIAYVFVNFSLRSRSLQFWADFVLFTFKTISKTLT